MFRRISRGDNRFEYYVEYTENVHRKELTRKEFDVLFCRFFETRLNGGEICVGGYEEDQLPAEDADKGSQFVNDL